MERMNMKKKLMCLLLSFLMLFSLTGCQEREAKEGEYQIYYLNMEMTKLVAEPYNSSGATGEALVNELLVKLKSAPESKELRQTIPVNVQVNGFQFNGSYLYVDFSNEYKDLTLTQEVLIRAAIARTLLQVEECSLVSFTVNSEPLYTANGTLVGPMSKDSFVENPGKQISSSVETTLTLYFSNSEGTGLVKETREVHYNTNISMEKLILEQLIQGTDASGALDTMPSSTKLISVSTADGVCYVNLSESFVNQDAVVNEEIVLYSIVNSLTEVPGVTRVQLSINGDTTGNVRYTYPLSKMYERDLSFVVSE